MHAAIFSNMTCTLVMVKQKMRLISFRTDHDDDSKVTNTEFDERNHWRYYLTRASRKFFGVYVCVGDDVIAVE